ncbi:MAG: linear amide C-N hydrolase [Pseudodesulfovibrio sp.]|nr:linear amide C-N hydrolase [Pseudodesulfovibrio sp.]
MFSTFHTFFVIVLFVLLQTSPALSCTRLIYTAGDGQVFTGRSMDWVEDLKSDIWAFPRDMKRDGGVGKDSIGWTSKYGSIILSGYNVASTDGINEEGLVANLLYLAESDYGKPNTKPGLSVGAWLQYALDNFSNVDEAVAAMRTEPFHIVAADLPNGSAPSLHLALSDSTGDSAIFEYIEGKLTIHHGKKFAVMTNEPTYDEQLAINEYWKEIGGMTMLPGTDRASDRFVRVSFYVDALPKFKDNRKAIAAAFSVIRNASVPLGITTPSQPNISTTIWRTVSDQKNRIYYYESAISPNVFWIDLDRVDFSKGQKARKISLRNHPVLAGEQSSAFVAAEPFKWLAP